MSPVLSVSPSSSLVDEEIVIHATGLQPHSDVTLLAQVKERNTRFYSHASFTADHNGEVDLTRMAPHAGRYSKCMPMGLFCSIIQEPNQKKGRRLIKQDVTTPLTFTLTLLSGVVEDEVDLFSKERQQLAIATCGRYYMGLGVERIPVKHNRIKATMFIPPGTGPFPGVLDMFGTVGGLVEHRAALLASRGFATIALNYFTLPEGGNTLGDKHEYNSMMKTDLEYYLEAIDLLLGHPKVFPRNVGIVGTSKGADVGLMISVCSPKVKACICIGGHLFNHLAPMKHKDIIFPSIDNSLLWDIGSYAGVQDGAMVVRDAYLWLQNNNKITKDLYIPIEKAENAHFLVIHGEDDLCVPIEFSQDVAKRLRSHGKSNYQIVTYPGAGHLIEPPYSPLTWSSLHAAIMGAISAWGGEVHQHAAAQEDSWNRMQHFLQQRLTPSHAL